MASWGNFTPSSSMRLKTFFSLRSVSNSGVAEPVATLTSSPRRMSLNLSCSPLMSESRAEPIFTGLPNASEAARS
jgi:hypothetical protein